MKQIHKFWTWFQDNEQAIKSAFLDGINTQEVFFHISRNLNYVSKRIGFIIKAPENVGDKCLIIFTSAGYRKLFPKLIALEEQAPPLELFKPQAFIKPIKKLPELTFGEGDVISTIHYKFKINHLQFSLLDFNIATKQLKLTIYIPIQNEIVNFEEIQEEMKWLLMEIIGEINYRKHIKYFELKPFPKNQNGLLNLFELQEYIDYLYKINLWRKPRVI